MTDHPLPRPSAPPLRAAFYGRTATDEPADDRSARTQYLLAKALLARPGPQVYPEDPGPHAGWTLANGEARALRVALYGRTASTHDPAVADAARARQILVGQRAAERLGAEIAATYFDSGCPATRPFHRREGGAALLKHATLFDAVIVANLARLGHGARDLGRSRLAVLLADLDQVIGPKEWTGTLAMILTGFGGDR
jgi:hypothetical protein